MEVLALVGPSGTGKSHRALWIAHEYGVDLIVDDGLLIHGSRILAGISSKRQPTKIGAIRTALFSKEEHAAEVSAKIKEMNPSKVLVLGTSREMVDKIAQRLNLPKPSQYISIEDVASPKEIARARLIRNKLGKHVVPAPTVEVKPRFSGTLIEPLQTFFRRRQPEPPSPEKKLWIEQTVVRPTFNYLGRFYIANHVLHSIISYTAEQVPGITRTGRVQIENQPEGIIINADLHALYGPPLPPVMRRAQWEIKNNVEFITALHVQKVNLTVRTLEVREEDTSS
ncbi:Asp23/Gls24 family envelope stress response protein [Calderihabitans maritimus]|uniref:Uncharacterized protein n=1 Tax=Calderihabitans maritimus TaxID=1246530 RepID=A0A1Z5HQQ4_9FIRM|nr:Asp23/Gls24 family envelope stress response protein [Calderihabitans maritimus]GAW91863.1 hypothetical protein Moth_1186 [Calderihabitans maritimus]